GDENVEPAEDTNRFVDGARDVGRAPEIRLDGHDVAAAGPDGSLRVAQRGPAAGTDRDAHSVARQRFSRRAPQSLACRADERDFLLRGASPPGLPDTVARSARRRLAPLRWLARGHSLALLPVEIRVGVIEPVLADGREQIQLERVVERLRLVLNPRRNVQDLAFADGDFLARDQELERPLQDVRDLLALVVVHGDDGALLQVDLGHHLALAGDDLPRDHLGDLLERELVPAVQAHGWRHRLPFETAGNYIMATHESDRGEA